MAHHPGRIRSYKTDPARRFRCPPAGSGRPPAWRDGCPLTFPWYHPSGRMWCTPARRSHPSSRTSGRENSFPPPRRPAARFGFPAPPGPGQTVPGPLRGPRTAGWNNPPSSWSQCRIRSRTEAPFQSCFPLHPLRRFPGGSTPSLPLTQRPAGRSLSEAPGQSSTG